MKILDIALKDLTQSFRSAIALMFMFLVPVLVTALFYFMFGGLRDSDEGEFSLPLTRVAIANLDQGSPLFDPQLPAGAGEMADQLGFDLSSFDSMGAVLAQILQSEAFAQLMAVTIAPDAAGARSLVDSQQAGVAIIIPPDFTAALVEEGVSAEVELYKDPTLTIGPEIVQTMLGRFLEFADSARIGTNVVLEQLDAAGIRIDEAQARALAMQFIAAPTSGNQAAPAEDPYVAVKPPAGGQQTGEDVFRNIISTIMGAMAVFYAFFTGASSAQSILREEENGTLPRLFTTPTPMSTILGGKFLSTALTVLVQFTVLMIFASLVFKVHWGAPLPLLLVVSGTICLTTTMGILLTSFLKNTRQGGFVFGGVLTMTGMIGMMNVWTMSAPNMSAVTQVAPLFVPQGWAMRTLILAMEGSPVASILPFFGVVLLLSVVFFVVGDRRLQKRFA